MNTVIDSEFCSRCQLNKGCHWALAGAALVWLHAVPALHASTNLSHAHLGPGRAGTMTVLPGGTIQVNAIVPGDAWDTWDVCEFAYCLVAGDFDVRARVESLSPNSRWSKAGLMVRENLSESARMAFNRVTPPPVLCGDGQVGANDSRFAYRTGRDETATGGGANGGRHEDGAGSPNYPNAWLRLERAGSVLRAYRGTDGTNWTLQGSQDTAAWAGGELPHAVLVGVGVAGGFGGVSNALARFASFRIQIGTNKPVFRLLSASSEGNPSGVKVAFSRPVRDDATNLWHWSLSPGAITGAQFTDTNVIWLRTAAPLVEGQSYTLTVSNVQDRSAPPERITPNPTVVRFLHGAGYEARRIRLERWNFIPGGSETNLLASQAYARDLPDVVYANALFEDTTPGTLDYFSGRIFGVLHVTNTGDYRFFVCSDDQSRLFLSTDDQPANKVEIAREPEWNNARDYATTDRRGPNRANRSAPIRLNAGQRYFLEQVFADAGQGNNASVAWQPPGAPEPGNGALPISEARFVPARFFNGTIFYNLGAPTFLAQPASQTVAVGDPVTFSARVDGTPPYAYQWLKSDGAGGFTNLPGANDVSFRLIRVQPSDQGMYALRVSNAAGQALSAAATLAVQLPTISIRSTNVLEGDCGTNFAVFALALSRASSLPVSVVCATSDQTAHSDPSRPPLDYEATTGVVTFAPGSVAATFRVPVIGDTRNEPDETFLVTLLPGSATNALVVPGTFAVGTIEDDELPGVAKVPEGIDLFTTPPGGTTWQDFGTQPIPAGFFGPGSDPFTNRIVFGGVPLDTFPPGALGFTDTIVRRLAPALVPFGGSNTVPVEICALSLASTSAVPVTYNGGTSADSWDVRACLSSMAPQAIGTLTLFAQSNGHGGTFTATLPVRPRLIFTRVGGGPTRVLDLGALPGQPTIDFLTLNGHWLNFDPGIFGLIIPPPGVLVDHDCDPNTLLKGPLPGSCGFFPGLREVCATNGLGATYLKRLTTERALQAAHGIVPSQTEEPDTDGDGVPDDADNCPLIPNPLQEDYDDDGIADYCDNCPFHYNPCQEDFNGNGLGDACEGRTNGPPIILVQPQSTNVPCGATVTFGVGAIGAPPLTYQWCFNGTPVPGGTAPTLTLPGVTRANAGDYVIKVSNGLGAVTSAVAVLTVMDTTPPVVTCPSNLVLTSFGTNGSLVIFSVAAYDVCDSNVTVFCAPPSASTFPVGTTTVLCMAADGSGNASSCSFTVTVNAGPLPKLDIQLTGSTVIVSWPAAATDYRLQATVSLAPPQWTNVTTVPTLVGSQWQVALDHPQGSAYFSLGPLCALGLGEDEIYLAVGATKLLHVFNFPFGGSLSWNLQPVDLAQVTLQPNPAGLDQLAIKGLRPGMGTLDVTYTVRGQTCSARVRICVGELPLTIDLDADADRNGVVDDYDEWGEDDFTYDDLTGLPGRGATILVNCDDDDSNQVPDNWVGRKINGVSEPADTVVNGASDIADIGELVARKLGITPLPDGLVVELKVAQPAITEPTYIAGIPADKRVRIFRPTLVSGSDLILQSGDAEIIGPTKGATAKFVKTPGPGELPFSLFEGTGRIVFGIEGLEFAAQVDVVLSVSLDNALVCDDKVRIKCAPFLLMANNNTVTRTVVAGTGRDCPNNDIYLNSFDASDGVTTTIISRTVSNGDRWAQDEWEIGFCKVPGPGGTDKTLTVVLDLPRNRGLWRVAIEQFLSDGVGVYHTLKGDVTKDAVNWGGNIECSGPVKVHGKDYRLGRIILGRPDSPEGGHDPLDTALLNFFQAQGVQDPILIDTGWLAVGHVDEIIGVVPVANTGDKRDFKMVIGSPRKALEVIDAIMDPSVKIMAGLRGPWEMSVGDFKANQRGLRSLNESAAVQGRIDTNKATLEAELGISLIEIPALYECPNTSPPWSDAGNVGTIELQLITINDITRTPFNQTLWSIEFTSATEFNVRYMDARVGAAWVLDGTGNTGGDYVSMRGITIPAARWQGAAFACDVIWFRTVQVERAFGAWLPGLQNAQVANNIVLAPNPFGPMVSGEDRIRKAYEAALAGLGLTFRYPEGEFRYYHQAMGEVHCSSNRFSDPYDEPDARWWKQVP